MQSNRAVGIVLLLVLAVGAVVAWQFLGGGEPATMPDGVTTHDKGAANAPGAGEATAIDGTAVVHNDAAGTREAVAPTDPGATDLPSITGQVVGSDQRPLADVEVLCRPGTGFTPDFENFDPTDVDAFDPATMVERMREQTKDLVTVRTDAEGRFRVRAEGNSKTVGLRVLARAHRVLDRTVVRPVDRDTDLGLLTLEPGAVISGRVLDATGKAIVAARVSRLLPIEENMPAGMDFQFPGIETMEDMRSGESIVTDEQGRFELAHVQAGDFTLRARHPEHPTAVRSGLSVAIGQSLTDVLVTMARGAEIRGTVIGAPDGTKALRVMAAARPQATNNPAAGIFGLMGDPSELLGEMGMAFGERNAEIGSDGAFVVRGLKADHTYRLWLAQGGGGFAGGGTCSERVEAAAGSRGIELRYDPGITVTFVVMDDATGKPIERLWVRDQLRGGGGFGDMMAFAPSTAREKAYPAGKVTVGDLRPKAEQKLRLTIDAIGYDQLQRDDIELPKNGSLDLGTLRLAPVPVLRVQVLTADGGRPVAGARVNLRQQGSDRGNPMARLAQMGSAGSPRSAQTDAEGKCTLNVLNDSIGKLEITSRDFAPAVEAPIAANTPREVVVRMVIGGSAEVTVLDPEQKPLQNTNVEHRTPTGDVDRRRTDAEGLARFTHLVPGNHGFRIAAERGGMGFAAQFARRSARSLEEEVPWQEVEVADKAAAQITLEKSPTAILRGIVRENGMPLAGATVAFREGQEAGGPEDLAAGIMGSMMGQMGGSTPRQAKTGDDGVYELSELPSGAHSLRITHRDRAMPSTTSVTLLDGDNRLDVDLDMTTLRGIVRDSLGNPVDGASVTVNPKREGDSEGAQAARMMARMMPGMSIGGPTQKTDASGAFELRGVAADVPLEVHATAKGLAPGVAEATVARGETKAQVELRLGAAGRIEVTVANAGMFAALQAKFVGPDAESVAPVVQMLRRGKGTLDGLLPGTWEVSYGGMNNRGDQPENKRTVEVLAGQTVTIDF